MKYRHNDVHVKASMPGDPQVVNGHFLVQSCSVTSGQDPDGRIHIGLIAPFGRNGKMRFVVGRKGSSGLADWFASRISAAETTFNDHPKKLNFAFMGQLTLTIEALGTLVFEHIVLAQGHTLNANNWWFGGRGATRVKAANGNWIALEGTLQGSGKKHKIYFLRGHASGVSNIRFTRSFAHPGTSVGSPPAKPIEVPMPKPQPGPSSKGVLVAVENARPERASTSVGISKAAKASKTVGVVRSAKRSETTTARTSEGGRDHEGGQGDEGGRRPGQRSAKGQRQDRKNSDGQHAQEDVTSDESQSTLHSRWKCEFERFLPEVPIEVSNVPKPLLLARPPGFYASSSCPAPSRSSGSARPDASPPALTGDAARRTCQTRLRLGSRWSGGAVL